LWIVCQLARIFSGVILEGPLAFESFYSEAEKILGLRQERIHDAVFETLAEVEEIAQGFKLHLNRQKDIIGVLENAGQTLIRVSGAVSECPLEADRRNLPSFASIDRQDNCVKNALEAVAHEIRNPLTAVGGFARKLAASLDPESQSGKYAKVILDEALRLEKILSEMPEQSLHPISCRAEA
jgi:nitrogen-specific signal transduction histidine kinase